MAILNFDGGFFSFAKGVSGRSENKAAAFPLQYGAAQLDLKCLCSASDAFLLARTRRFARKEVRPSHIVTFSFFFPPPCSELFNVSEATAAAAAPGSTCVAAAG